MKNASIKGLIVKDILNLTHYKFSFFVIIVMFIVLGMANKQSLSYLPIMLMAMTGMIGLSTFNYDEVSKADKYLLTLPTNKRELVKAKYILSISMVLIGAIISTIVMIGINELVYKEIMDFNAMCITLISGIFGISLITCIQIPSIYKWGAEKGRIQMFILIFVICALVGGIIYLISSSGWNQPFNTSGIISILEKFGIYIIIALTCFMYFLSYRLSCKIYEKKEI